MYQDPEELSAVLDDELQIWSELKPDGVPNPANVEGIQFIRRDASSWSIMCTKDFPPDDNELAWHCVENLVGFVRSIVTGDKETTVFTGSHIRASDTVVPGQPMNLNDASLLSTLRCVALTAPVDTDPWFGVLLNETPQTQTNVQMYFWNGRPWKCQMQQQFTHRTGPPSRFDIWQARTMLFQLDDRIMLYAGRVIRRRRLLQQKRLSEHLIDCVCSYWYYPC